MLTSQAHTLDAIFNKMCVLSAANLSKSLDIAERLMRLGLKAQSQARATLETLAQIKSPPVVYARQANVTTAATKQLRCALAPTHPTIRVNRCATSERRSTGP